MVNRIDVGIRFEQLARAGPLHYQDVDLGGREIQPQLMKQRRCEQRVTDAGQ